MIIITEQLPVKNKCHFQTADGSTFPVRSDSSINCIEEKYIHMN